MVKRVKGKLVNEDEMSDQPSLAVSFPTFTRYPITVRKDAEKKKSSFLVRKAVNKTSSEYERRRSRGMREKIAGAT